MWVFVEACGAGCQLGDFGKVVGLDDGDPIVMPQAPPPGEMCIKFVDLVKVAKCGVVPHLLANPFLDQLAVKCAAHLPGHVPRVATTDSEDEAHSGSEADDEHDSSDDAETGTLPRV